MYLIIDYQCTSVIYCTFLITGKKPSIVSISNVVPLISVVKCTLLLCAIMSFLP